MFDAISASDLDRYLEEGTYQLIDLRSPSEYRRKHLMGAVNLPFERKEYLTGVSMNRPVILYCERGPRSIEAARELDAAGYRARFVAGGLRAYRGKYLRLF